MLCYCNVSNSAMSPTGLEHYLRVYDYRLSSTRDSQVGPPSAGSGRIRLFRIDMPSLLGDSTVAEHSPSATSAVVVASACGIVSTFTFLSRPDATKERTPVFFAFMVRPLVEKAACNRYLMQLSYYYGSYAQRSVFRRTWPYGHTGLLQEYPTPYCRRSAVISPAAGLSASITGAQYRFKSTLDGRSGNLTTSRWHRILPPPFGELLLQYCEEYRPDSYGAMCFALLPVQFAQIRLRPRRGLPHLRHFSHADPGPSENPGDYIYYVCHSFLYCVKGVDDHDGSRRHGSLAARKILTDPICRLPLPTLVYRLEALYLGDLLRIWVRTGATPPRGPLLDFQGPREDPDTAATAFTIFRVPTCTLWVRLFSLLGPCFKTGPKSTQSSSRVISPALRSSKEIVVRLYYIYIYIIRRRRDDDAWLDYAACPGQELLPYIALSWTREHARSTRARSLTSHTLLLPRERGGLSSTLRQPRRDPRARARQPTDHDDNWPASPTRTSEAGLRVVENEEARDYLAASILLSDLHSKKERKTQTRFSALLMNYFSIYSFSFGAYIRITYKLLARARHVYHHRARPSLPCVCACVRLSAILDRIFRSVVVHSFDPQTSLFRTTPNGGASTPPFREYRERAQRAREPS
ncbi:hypothetical protein PUN28_017820 [Cardiocondyla obscurior]|uniref:Uncharacterized protein n=1 Tax=Cardiocondyla obscurior TaxID=286306 RepID=A0AAW2EJ80_9HYME